MYQKQLYTLATVVDLSVCDIYSLNYEHCSVRQIFIRRLGGVDSVPEERTKKGDKSMRVRVGCLNAQQEPESRVLECYALAPLVIRNS